MLEYILGIGILLTTKLGGGDSLGKKNVYAAEQFY